VAKNLKTCPHCDVTSRKHQTENVSISTRRLAESVEGLNSSLALAAGDFWPKKACQSRPLKGKNHHSATSQSACLLCILLKRCSKSSRSHILKFEGFGFWVFWGWHHEWGRF